MSVVKTTTCWQFPRKKIPLVFKRFVQHRIHISSKMKASVAMHRPQSKICCPYPENGITASGDRYRVFLDPILEVNARVIFYFCLSVISPPSVVAEAFRICSTENRYIWYQKLGWLLLPNLLKSNLFWELEIYDREYITDVPLVTDLCQNLEI